MPLAAIGLGSNLGDRAGTLHQAIGRVQSLGTVTAVSAFFDTAPVHYLEQPRFLNAAALVDTTLSPLALLHGLLLIEEEFGRDRTHGIAKGPRTLDLDLLLYGEEVVSLPELTIPHPEMHHRRFVLEPLAGIAPAWVHPTEHRSIADLLRQMDERTILANDWGS